MGLQIPERVRLCRVRMRVQYEKPAELQLTVLKKEKHLFVASAAVIGKHLYVVTDAHYGPVALSGAVQGWRGRPCTRLPSRGADTLSSSLSSSGRAGQPAECTGSAHRSGQRRLSGSAALLPCVWQPSAYCAHRTWAHHVGLPECLVSC